MMTLKVDKRIYAAGRTCQIRLPLEFIKTLDIAINELVDVELKDNQIIITKKLKEVR